MLNIHPKRSSLAYSGAEGDNLEWTMQYDQDANAINFVSGFLLGAVVGAGIAFLTAPEPGNRPRRRISRVVGELRDTATDQLDAFADDVKLKVDEAVRGGRKKFASK